MNSIEDERNPNFTGDDGKLKVPEMGFMGFIGFMVLMGLIITFAVGSLFIVSVRNSHSMWVVLIWAAVVTYLEFNLILWMEVASYYTTAVITVLSSGTAVCIIALRFRSSVGVSQEVKSEDKLLAVSLTLSWYLFLLPDQSVFFSMGLIITTFTVGSLLIVSVRNSHSMGAVLIGAAVVTLVEFNIILLKEVAPYNVTVVLTVVSSGTAVWIIAQTFNSSQTPRPIREARGARGAREAREAREAKIGIFSRSSPEEYIWLSNYLRESTRHTVASFVITNTNSFKFREEVYQCNYAILYHSLRRGRINITDVTDSLYDDELEYLSSELGKDKVAVVVDDLDDNSSTARNRILQSQPKIDKLAWNIFLINKESKQNISIIRNLMNPIKEKFMADGSSHSLGSAIVPVCFLAVWVAAILCVRTPDDFYNTILEVITNLKVSFMIYTAAFSGSDIDYLLPLFVDSPSRKKTSHQKRHLACPLLTSVSAVLLVECIVMIWGVWSVQMVPYIVIALGMDLLVILLFIKGPQIFSCGHPSKCL